MSTMKSDSTKLKPSAWDMLIVAAVLLLASTALYAFAPRGTAVRTVITQDGTQLLTRDLAALPQEGEYVEITGKYPLTVFLSPSEIYVVSADCPTQDCVRSGSISRAGESIVCLPGRVVITIEGDSGNYDLIAG